jgi:iron complex outermembrane receptor protein
MRLQHILRVANPSLIIFFLGYRRFHVSYSLVRLVVFMMMGLCCQADLTAAERGKEMSKISQLHAENSKSTIISFNIKAQALAPALIEFGQQAGLSVLLQHALRDVKTQGLKGNHEPIFGLEVLLSGTGLDFKATGGGIVVSQPVARIQSMVIKTEKPATLLSRVGLILTAVLVGTPAVAESVDPPSKIIEEIVVTAQKREGSLRKTPIAITAITADMIEKIDMTDINSLAQMSPSLTFNHAFAGLQLYIRGVGQDAPSVGNSPGVAVYVDGVYHGHQFANSATSVDTERFEVVRGPQGTLYGRNSTGGNINITSVKPHFGRELKVAATAGSDSLQKYAVTGNVPVVEDLVAIRGTVVSRDRDGYRKNLFDGSDVEEIDSIAASMSVLVTPNSYLEMLFRADYQKEKGTPRPTSYLEAIAGSGTSPLLFGGRTGGRASTDVFHDVQEAQTVELKGLNATLTWLMENVTLKSITSFRESERFSFADADGTDAAFTTNTNITETEEFSQEFNLLGSAMDGKLEWIAGVNYYADDAFSSALFRLPIFSLFFPGLPASPNAFGTVTSEPFIHAVIDEELRSTGVFAQATYSLSDQTRLTLGYRYTREEKNVAVSSVSNFTPPAGQCLGAKGSEDWAPSTAKIGMDHTPSLSG